MELRKKLLAIVSLAFAAALSTGVAVSAGADGENKMDPNFAITGVSVRYDDANRDDDGSGIRFKVDVPESWTEATVTEAYTMVTLTPQSGTFAGVEKYAKVAALEWRPEADGWNTVLVGIPEDDYITQVKAQAFVAIGTDVYETAVVEYSLAEAAALVMNKAGKLDDRLTGYVGVDSIALDETAAIAYGETLQLTAKTAPIEYAVVWSSDNTDVVTVDKDGKVTTVGVGTANVTASMGDKTATCTVTVEKPYMLDSTIDLGNEVVVNVTGSTSNTVSFTVTGTSYMVFDKDFLKDAFVTQNANSFTFKVTNSSVSLGGCYTGYPKIVLLYANANGGTSIKTLKSDATYSAADGAVYLTIDKSHFTTYFNNDGTSNETQAGALTLGMRHAFTNVNGNVNKAGTYTFSDVTYNTLLNVANMLDLTTTVGTNQMVAALDSASADAITFTTTGTYYITFNMDFLVDVFVTRQASSLTFKIAHATATFTGCYTSYPKYSVYCTDSNGAETAKNTVLDSYTVVDGAVYITIDKTLFTKYCNDDGTFNGTVANAYAIGMRMSFMLSNGNAYAKGTFTISDVTCE